MQNYFRQKNEKSTSENPKCFLKWEQRESNPRPSACKADALNQLSYAPKLNPAGISETGLQIYDNFIIMQAFPVFFFSFFTFFTEETGIHAESYFLGSSRDALPKSAERSPTLLFPNS